MDALQVASVHNNEFVGRVRDQFVGTSITDLTMQGNNLDREATHIAIIEPASEPVLAAMDTANLDDQ